MTKFEQLREKHKEFIYESYEVNKDSFVFHFRIGEHAFSPKWRTLSQRNCLTTRFSLWACPSW